MKKCCIVIPVYEEYLTHTTEISINSVIVRYYNIFDIYIIHPDNLNIAYRDEFEKIYPKIEFKNISEWSENNIKSYNSMCLSKSFYERFEEYEYMLLVQTDAYVFEQDLDYWLNLGYDYIGSPSYVQPFQAIKDTYDYVYIPLTDFGLDYNGEFVLYNGGLSLRKIKSIIRVLDYIDEKGLNFKEKHICEDMVYSAINLFKDNILNLPDIPLSAAFSWDRTANYCVIMNEDLGKFIPVDYVFGAHGINKFDTFELYKNTTQHTEFLKSNILYRNCIKKRIINDFIRINKHTSKRYNKKCCIVIPVYNKIPTLFEEISINNVLKKFENKYDICIIHSELLDTSYYIQNFKVKYIKIPAYIYDNTYNSYNNMCLTSYFYNMFTEYEYILLSQTDSFIFNDDLEYWLNMGYDYIGGADIHIHHTDDIKSLIKNPVFIDKLEDHRLNMYNINGGLSLRKVHSFYVCTKILNILIPYYDGEDMVFSMINEISGVNILNLCPMEICEKFSNGYEVIPDEKIENIFGSHALMKFHQIANNNNIPYSLPYKSYITDGCLETIDKLNTKFFRHIIKN